MGFEIASSPAKRRLLVSIEGRVKHGKTHFALTAPGPIAVQNLDMGLDGVVQKFQHSKIVQVAHYEGVKSEDLKTLSPEQIASKVGETWERFVEDYRWALRNVRTLIVDTGTEAWELARLARLGKIGNVKPHHYSMVNMEFRELIREAENHDCNLILTHRVKKEYVNEQYTGKYERAGFSDIGSWVHLLARAERREDGFHVIVQECRQNATLAGLDLPEQMATFPQLAQLVFPDSSESEWV